MTYRPLGALDRRALAARAIAYELLLGRFCQTRDGRLYIHLTEYVMPRLTRAEEELRCARRFRANHSEEKTPMRAPRNPRYEAWKRRHCPRFYYFDHELDAPKTLRRRLARDPECRVPRRPSKAELQRRFPAPPGARPPMLEYRGHQPPPRPKVHVLP